MPPRGQAAELERIRARLEEAERSSEEKTRFIRHVSHEFRTPLSSIIGFAAPVAAPAPADGVVLPRGLTLDEVEARYIDETLRELGGNVSAAADRLGVSRKVLWQRRKRHGLLTGRE